MIFRIIKFTIIFLFGFIVGAYLFSDTQKRSFVTVEDCEENCFKPEELLGLLGSVGIQRAPGVIPFVVKETNKTVVMKHPFPKYDYHYVVIPKKDIKDISQMREEDREYLMDALSVIGEVVREEKLERYRVLTNGEQYQSFAYLHFQII